MSIVKNRSELLFLYDVKDANPNGDPAEENKPRIDEETGINIVTDVRLKRTIRDYLSNFKHLNVFVREELKQDGSIKTREEKLEEAEIKTKADAEKLLKDNIDLRLFGATIAARGKKSKQEPEEKESKPKGEKVFTWIGPVQFRFGRSLHKVEPVLIKGTSVLPSTEMKAAGTFTETWIVPYSLICFYGIVNENEAKNTLLKEDDVNLMMEAMWNGTKNLITRSKMGHNPRLLLRVDYKEGNYHIGDLDKKVKIMTDKSDEQLRNITDLKLDITELLKTLGSNKHKIDSIRLEVSTDLVATLVDNTTMKEYKGSQLLDLFRERLGVPVELMNFDRQ
ncbi:MAG: type I-B CRISPR-associated protein Cas7/Csh2 [Candidatus Caldarchaeum sp.]